MGDSVGQPLRPGLAEGLQRSAPLDGTDTQDFAWAAGDAHVLRTWQSFRRVILGLGERHVPPQIRALLVDTLEKWNGEDVGLSRRWVYDLSGSLPPQQQPMARFALLVALASHQVDDQVVRDFVPKEGHDHLLVSVAAWASAMATFRVDKWIGPSPLFNS
jgi:hypothetical protein